MTLIHSLLVLLLGFTLALVYGHWRRVRHPRSNSLLDLYDGGHLGEDVVGLIEDSASSAEELCAAYLEAAGGESKGYARWACRLAAEFKLEFGIPTRTTANRTMVREVLYKRLSKKNTRHRHMRAVLPLAIELCFLKDATELEIDQLMCQPEMVRRAQQSVTNYWSTKGVVDAWAKTLLPWGVYMALARRYPGTLGAVPGFRE